MSEPLTVAILGAGDMGSAVARVLTDRGIRVTICLHGRGERSRQLAVRTLGPDTGRASAIKMVYASLTKGTHALRAAAAMAGELLGVGDEIRGEWQSSLPDAWHAMEGRLPRRSPGAGPGSCGKSREPTRPSA